MNMKNSNLSQQDPNQIATLEHDNSKDAKRVTIVDDIKLSFDQDKMIAAMQEGMSQIKFPSIQSKQESEKIQIVEIEKQVIITQIEYKTIEVPVIVKEIEYREIEKPIYIKEIVTIEKPVIVKEIEFKEISRERYYPLLITICNVTQALCVLSLLLFSIFKK